MATKTTRALILALWGIWLFFLVTRIRTPETSAKLAFERRLNSRSPDAICRGFEGDPAFYGLGIRIGIYLQWFSAWLSNAMHPMGAAFNHDANSIFLLALLLALSVARSKSDVHPVEIYIMLLLSNGFVFTILSVFGVRLYFLQPGTMSEFLQGLKRWWDKIQNGWKRRARDKASASPLRWFDATVNASIGTASSIKHPSLSWAGVAWRTAVLVFLTGLNVSFWFSLPSTAACTHLIFFFGYQPLKGALITFFKAASIIMLIPYSWFLYLCIKLALSLAVSAVGIDRQRRGIEVAETILPQKASEAQKRRLGNFLDISASTLAMTPEGKFLLMLGRLLSRETSPHPFRNIAEAYTMLLSRGIESSLPEHQRVRGIGESNGVQTMPFVILGTYLCILTHLIIGTVIACFVAFIEYTLHSSDISGVYTLGTTDPLIPFTIGVASTLAAFRECALLYMRTMYPEWHQSSLNLRLERSVGGNGIALEFIAPPRETAAVVGDSEEKHAQRNLRNRTRANSAPGSVRNQKLREDDAVT